MVNLLQPLEDDEWPARAASLLPGFAGKLNVYRTMAHHPALLNAWADLRDHLVCKSALGPEQSEVVILRTGHRLGSAYEAAHHVVRARKLGMEDARILSLRGDPASMTPDDALLCTAVDELFAEHRLTPATRDRAMEELGAEGTLDLIATAGFYAVLGGILNTFDTPIDNDIEAALADRPLAPSDANR